MTETFAPFEFEPCCEPVLTTSSVFEPVITGFVFCTDQQQRPRMMIEIVTLLNLEWRYLCVHSVQSNIQLDWDWRSSWSRDSNIEVGVGIWTWRWLMAINWTVLEKLKIGSQWVWTEDYRFQRVSWWMKYELLRHWIVGARIVTLVVL